MRFVSCKQQIVGSSFLIQFVSWCLLMGEFGPLTFRQRNQWGGMNKQNKQETKQKKK
jgi:hypothetical protein